jgi:hypothetical protein
LQRDEWFHVTNLDLDYLVCSQLSPLKRAETVATSELHICLLPVNGMLMPEESNADEVQYRLNQIRSMGQADSRVCTPKQGAREKKVADSITATG